MGPKVTILYPPATHEKRAGEFFEFSRKASNALELVVLVDKVDAYVTVAALNEEGHWDAGELVEFIPRRWRFRFSRLNSNKHGQHYTLFAQATDNNTGESEVRTLPIICKP
jgi:hypothetical protein